MKNLITKFKWSITFSLLIIAGITFSSFNNQISAQGGGNGQKNFEQSLLEKLDQVLEILIPTTNKKETGGGQEADLQYYESGVLSPSCLDNYESWPKSKTYKENADWSLEFIRGNATSSNAGTPLESFFDVNADGLTDYIYKSSSYSNGTGYNTLVYDTNGLIDKYRNLETCIHLNNGSGWEVGYRCKSLAKANGETLQQYGRTFYKYDLYFYGDCAQL